jgi:MFS family permease
MTAPLSNRLRILIAAYALSCVGTGLIFPFTAIYLIDVRHLGAGAAGLFFGVVAATAFAWAPVAGRLVDTYRPARISAAGVLLQAIGYALLATVHNVPVMLVCAALIGLGNGSFYPGFTPVINSLLAPEQRKRGFSARYLAMNLGLGTGAAIAGPLIGLFDSARAYAVLYVADGLTFLPFAAGLFLLGRSAVRAPADSGGAPATYRTLLRHRPLLVLLVTQTLLVLFGYSQMDTAVPLVMTRHLGLAATVVGLVIAVNTIAVVVLQVPLTRLLERLPTATVLGLGPFIWAAAAGLGLIAGFVPTGARIALLLGYAVVFAVGEACYAMAYQTLLTEITPEEALGRGSAMSSLSWNIGAMGGPALGILVVSLSAGPALYWILYGAVLIGTGALALTLRPRRTAEAPVLARSE